MKFDLDLEYPALPFYFFWSPCGTRLALMSNWENHRVGLRIVALAPQTLLDPRNGPPPCIVPVATGRPLFMDWSPDGSKLALVGAFRH